MSLKSILSGTVMAAALAVAANAGITGTAVSGSTWDSIAPSAPSWGPIEPYWGPIEPYWGPIEPYWGPIEPYNPSWGPIEPY